MEFYETKEMTFRQMINFKNSFEILIGTEIETNNTGADSYYCVCCELEGNEIELCNEIENNAIKNY